MLHFIIIFKKGWQCKAGRERLTPYQSEDPSPTIPTHRMKEEKGKAVYRRRRGAALSTCRTFLKEIILNWYNHILFYTPTTENSLVLTLQYCTLYQ